MLILDKMARHNSFIIWLLCSPKNLAYDSGGTELMHLIYKAPFMGEG